MPRLVPVVILTGSSRDALQALKCGAHDFFQKGEVGRATLRRSLEMAVDRHQALERLALRPMPGSTEQTIEDLKNQLAVAITSLAAVEQHLKEDSPLKVLQERALGALRSSTSLLEELDRLRDES